jgi:CheY-like chemotaxis protein
MHTHTHTHTHPVQFYNNDQHLFNTITNYLSPLFDESYEDGTSAVIIARPAPTRYLKDALKTRGYKSEFGDTNQPRSNELLNLFDASTNKGRHVLFIDAHQLLGQLMNGTGINNSDFEGMMSDVLSLLPGSEKRTGERQSLLYAYGELVDILCERQQHWIALELENLWNNLLSARHFSLLCGYRMDSFQDEGVADVFQHICQTHTNVLPTESYAIQGTTEQKLTMVAALQQNVASLEASVKRQYDSFKREEQQRRHQEQFVDILFHQLRNPVSCIAGNVELLMAGLEARNAVLDSIVAGHGLAKPSDVALVKTQLLDDAESVDAIVTCATHMKTVTDGLLSLSREKGRALRTLSHQTLNELCIGPPPSTNPEPNSNLKSSPSHTKHVLLVDPNPLSSRVHVRLLEASKILVTTASNGYEAIGKLINHFQSESPVDVVLMELDIPFMDGVGTTRAIRQLRVSERDSLASTLTSKISNVPIIGMTFHLRREKYVDVGLAGMNECVERPISREVLLSLIDAVLSKT